MLSSSQTPSASSRCRPNTWRRWRGRRRAPVHTFFHAPGGGLATLASSAAASPVSRRSATNPDLPAENASPPCYRRAVRRPGHRRCSAGRSSDNLRLGARHYAVRSTSRPSAYTASRKIGPQISGVRPSSTARRMRALLAHRLQPGPSLPPPAASFGSRGRGLVCPRTVAQQPVEETPCSARRWRTPRAALVARQPPGYHNSRAIGTFRQSGFSGRGVSGRLAHARRDRPGAAVSSRCPPPSPHRHRHAANGFGLRCIDDRQEQRSFFPRAL